MENRTRIGIKDIAERAKVSIGTVDRVIHNRKEVSSVTKEHVLAIIKEMGYTPNLLAKSLALKKNYKIAILIPDYKNDNPYWKKPLLGIQNASSELHSYNFDIKVIPFDINNERLFKAKSDEILKSQPDGLIFAPIYYNTSLEIIKNCNEQNIPFVFIDILLNDVGALSFFGQNSFKSGYLAARLMSYGLPENATTLVIKYLNESAAFQHLDQRENGFCSFFSSNENVKNISICTTCIDVLSNNSIHEGVTQAFIKNPTIKGIFVTNSRSYKIANYLEVNKINNMLLVGYDLLDENIRYLDKGIIHFLIGQKPEEQGYKSVIALFNHLMKYKDVEKLNYSPIDIIMKDNLDYYKNIYSL